MNRSGGLFRVSALDAITIALSTIQIVVAVVGVAYFPNLSAPALFALAAGSGLLMFLNVNGLAHTLIHGGVFRSRALDAIAGVFNSLALGVPQTLYHVHHLNHHVGNSDRKQPDGSTRDWSSIYRFGRNGQPEHVISYALLNLLRGDMRAMLAEVRRQRRGRRLLCESIALGLGLVALARVDLRGFAWFYLPAFYVGWALAAADAYYKHWLVQPGDGYANSVSSYGSLYNWLTFNTGHHQEHHLRPNAHWTQLPRIRSEFAERMRAHGTRVIRGPHLTSFLERPRKAGLQERT